MATTYDAIIIGGGHNGLVNAAYLARAGKQVLVLERRHLVGGAAVTEEIFPGFKYTEFSYVVSLLRPEIIRDLNLPKHGLHILPLPSTFVPLPNGDYYAAWDDHDKTRREVYRHSPQDAEALDEFGVLMQHMAMAVKPILGMVPADPTSLHPQDLLGLARLGKHFRNLGEERFHALFKLMTMSSADYLDEWFECEPLKATKSASGIIGTFWGRARRAPPTCCCITTWARSTARFEPGALPKAAPERSAKRSRARPIIRRRDSLECACITNHREERPGAGRGAVERRRNLREGRQLQSRSTPDVFTAAR